MGFVWSYCQGGQLTWSTESHICGQSNHPNHHAPHSTTQAQHYLNHIHIKIAVFTQKLISWGILWDWAQLNRRLTARAWAPRLHLYLVLNIVFKHHAHLSLSIADQFSTVWYLLAPTVQSITILRLSILATRALNLHTFSMGVVASVSFAWHHASFWEESEVGNSKMVNSWESLI